MDHRQLAEWSSRILELAGLASILLGAAVAVGAFVHRLVRRIQPWNAYERLRVDLGRAILLGLEFLVAADIIRTVAFAPTIDNVVTLGLIVLIRTFLSFSLEIELERRWPWKSGEKRGTAERV